MKIELRNLSEITPYQNNPRVNDDAVAAVAASIQEFGFRQPIVVDRHGLIVVGHTRWKAAKQLGLERVPVHVAKDLTPEQAKAYRIADNQSASLAEWDLDLLPIELAELQNADFDLSLLGFSEDELTNLLDPGLKDGLTDPDDIPEPPDEATTTRVREYEGSRGQTLFSVFNRPCLISACSFFSRDDVLKARWARRMRLLTLSG